MCLLAIMFRLVEDAPLIVGANREEFYARGGEPPGVITGQPRIVAGIDPRAGGTWLGMNEHGVVVGVANRFKPEAPKQPRSRGLLARDLLGCSSAKVAVDLAAKELGSNRYAGCNFLVADATRVVILQAGDWLRVKPLPPGIHAFTSSDVNDAGDRRLGHALWWLTSREYPRANDCLKALCELCGQTGNGDPPMCLRGQDRGTVSSTVIAVRSPVSRSVYLHAQGPPDKTAYVDYSPLLGKGSPGAATPGLT